MSNVKQLFKNSWPKTIVRDNMSLVKGSGYMLEKASDYKGVIIFYLLLVIILLVLAYQSRIYNNQLENDEVKIAVNQ